MPHVVRWRGRELLIFCVRQPDTDIWRPAYTDWNDESDPVRPLPVPHPGTICNPYCFVNADDGLTFSYMARDEHTDWQLYQTSTRDLVTFTTTLQQTTTPCWSGFAAPDAIVTADYDFFTVDRGSVKKTYRLTPVDTIFRVFPVGGDGVLITAAVATNFCTYLFRETPFTFKQVQTLDGEEVYKSTIYNEYLIAAKIQNDAINIEQRKLFYTTTYTLANPASMTLLDVSNPQNAVTLYG